MNFIAPVYRKEVYAIGKVIKAGRQLIVWEVKVYTAEDEKLVALGISSYSRIVMRKGTPATVGS